MDPSEVLVDIAQRIGVSPEQADKASLLHNSMLREPGDLLSKAWDLGPRDPAAAQTYLAAAVLAYGQRTADGRHAATLSLLAPLVGKADPYKTLGPAGQPIRAEVMPNGWGPTLQSPERLRYAWREGLWKLLDLDEDDQGIVNALNEVTRLSPAEPEPTRVNIQETFPAPKIAFTISIIGLTLAMRSLWKDLNGR